MLISKIEGPYTITNGERVCQGDILRDVMFTLTDPLDPEFEDSVFLKYAVVMSQDCDLDLDFKTRQEEGKNNDKYLSTILLCPAYPSESFYKGEHIADWKMSKFEGKNLLDYLHKNDKLNRYHFLIGNTELGLPDLVIDFKHFYTAPRDILYKEFKTLYVLTVNELFRERLSQRFTNYLSRFGLPETTED